MLYDNVLYVEFRDFQGAIENGQGSGKNFHMMGTGLESGTWPAPARRQMTSIKQLHRHSSNVEQPGSPPGQILVIIIKRRPRAFYYPILNTSFPKKKAEIHLLIGIPIHRQNLYRIIAFFIFIHLLYRLLHNDRDAAKCRNTV